METTHRVKVAIREMRTALKVLHGDESKHSLDDLASVDQPFDSHGQEVTGHGQSCSRSIHRLGLVSPVRSI